MAWFFGRSARKANFTALCKSKIAQSLIKTPALREGNWAIKITSLFFPSIIKHP
jgi:hypothetical protein